MNDDKAKKCHEDLKVLFNQKMEQYEKDLDKYSKLKEKEKKKEPNKPSLLSIYFKIGTRYLVLNQVFIYF
jgi:glutaredoxin